MRRVWLLVMCSLWLVGCGDSGGGFGGPGGTYCEINCGCSGRLGAPASIVQQCVNACSSGGGTAFDVCPPEVTAFGECLYATSNCDTGACQAELDALSDCVFGE